MYTLDLMVDNGDLKEFELLHIEEQDKESAFDVFMDEIINEEKAFYVQNDENAKKLGRLINSELGGLDDCDYYSLSLPTKYEIMTIYVNFENSVIPLEKAKNRLRDYNGYFAMLDTMQIN